MRKGILIGLNGVAQSGKDTVGNILVENYGFKRLAFADALRDGLYNLNPLIPVADVTNPEGFVGTLSLTVYPTYTHRRLQGVIDELGWDAAKVQYPEVRELMQRYGTEAGREIHGNTCWTDIVEREVEENPEQRYVITDMRFDNEVSAVRSWGGYLVQMQRDGVTSVNGHISDKILPENLFHAILHNNGTLRDLEVAVSDMMREVEAMY